MANAGFAMIKKEDVELGRRLHDRLGPVDFHSYTFGVTRAHEEKPYESERFSRLITDEPD